MKWWGIGGPIAAWSLGLWCPPGAGLALAQTLPGRAPRLVHPPTFSVVSSQQPRVRWEAGADGGPFVVEFCRDRACGTVIEAVPTTGLSATPASALPRGVVFWRVRGSATGASASATWSLTVPGRDAATQTAWGQRCDVNGDGLADLPFVDQVYRGDPSGVPTPDPLAARQRGGVSALVNVGDLDGDGYTDLVTVTRRPRNRGALLSFLLGGAGPLAQARTLAAPPTRDAVSEVVGLGDMNGDGYGDVALLVRAARPRRGATAPARVLVFPASGHGWSTPWTVEVGTTHPQVTLNPIGDLNADGYADLALGLWDYLNTRGEVRIFFGGPSGPAPTASRTLTPPPTGDSENHARFGEWVATVGDLDGDGFPDLAVGHSQCARFYRGGASFDGAGVTWSVCSNDEGDSDQVRVWCHTGMIAGLGDVDGDGFGEVLLGSGEAGAESSGTSWLFPGSPQGPRATPTASLRSVEDLSASGFGAFLVGPGDVNGDGFDDAAVIASGCNPIGECHRGDVALYLGSANGLRLDTARLLSRGRP